MITGKRHGGGVILLTFIAALLLTVIPLPDWARYLRPDWVGLVLIYWCMALPDRVGVTTGWLMGLMVDSADRHRAGSTCGFTDSGCLSDTEVSSATATVSGNATGNDCAGTADPAPVTGTVDKPHHRPTCCAMVFLDAVRTRHADLATGISPAARHSSRLPG